MTVELMNRPMSTELPDKTGVEPVAADVFGRIGTLETRLARSDREIEAAQAIRYRVFVEEMQAQLMSIPGMRSATTCW